MVDNCRGMLRPYGQVANRGKRSTGSVYSDFDNVQCDSKSSRKVHQILGIRWGGDEVPGGIGTFPVDNKCLLSLFPV